MFYLVCWCDYYQSGAASTAAIATTAAAATATVAAWRGASTAVCSYTATGRAYHPLVLDNPGKN